MENKRITRKLNSWFWWLLMALPLLLLIFTYIFALPQYAKNYDWTNSSWYEFISYAFDDSDIYVNVVNQFDNFSITHIFTSIFNTLNVNYMFVAYLLNWCLTIYFIHLIFDCVAFIFDWLHDFFERG